MIEKCWMKPAEFIQSRCARQGTWMADPGRWERWWAAHPRWAAWVQRRLRLSDCSAAPALSSAPPGRRHACGWTCARATTPGRRRCPTRSRWIATPLTTMSSRAAARPIPSCHTASVGARTLGSLRSSSKWPGATIRSFSSSSHFLLDSASLSGN